MANPILFSQHDDYCILRDVKDAGASVAVGPERLAGLREMACYIVFGPNAVGGSVIVEAAHSIGHSGAWAKLAQVDWVESGRVHRLATTGAHLALRIRVVAPIIGDTISVYAVGN